MAGAVTEELPEAVVAHGGHVGPATVVSRGIGCTMGAWLLAGTKGEVLLALVKVPGAVFVDGQGPGRRAPTLPARAAVLVAELLAGMAALHPGKKFC